MQCGESTAVARAAGMLVVAAGGFTQYSIDPVHLGVVFLVNPERGFLQPPVGINLFLTSIDSLAAGATGTLVR